MASRIITFSGVSCSGKTTIVNLLKARKQFPVDILQKVTTRESRLNESMEILCVKTIDYKKYDIIYHQYGVRYGLSSETIWRSLRNGKYVLAIINDMRAIGDIKEAFGNLAVPCYLYRDISPGALRQMIKKRLLDSSTETDEKDEIQLRIDKLPVMFQKYVENITLFDHIILNVGTKSYMVEQMENIITHYDHLDNQISLVNIYKGGVKV